MIKIKESELLSEWIQPPENSGSIIQEHFNLTMDLMLFRKYDSGDGTTTIWAYEIPMHYEPWNQRPELIEYLGDVSIISL